MTVDELNLMIQKGDQQKHHVVYEGMHYFKFGSYWTYVDMDLPVLQKEYDYEIIMELNPDERMAGHQRNKRLSHSSRSR